MTRDRGDDCHRLARIKPNLERRALINQFTRAFFQEQGFYEIETPIRVPAVAPELHIVPFGSEGWFLSTSPELHMKRLLAAGYDRLFQFSHCFRKDEHGRRHNPEFIMLEWYRAGGDYMQMVHDTEQLVVTLADKLGVSRAIRYQGQGIDLAPPWPKITVRDAFLHAAGWDPVDSFDPLLFDTDLVSGVLPGLAADRPTVLYDYPAAAASLARLKPDSPAVAERAEIFIGGLELANAYSELTDEQEQASRFREEIERIYQERRQRMDMPRRFLDVLPCLPQCGGIALGMDRLAMLFCDAASIDEVMAFTVDNV